MIPADCPLFLKPRLRLFLSADIVGSTALKQSQVSLLREDSSKSGSAWFYVIQGFYIEAKIAFMKEWESVRKRADGKSFMHGEDPLLWKTIGDEILFTKVLTDYRQLSVTLSCWMKALRRIRGVLKSRDSRLDVKSTAWIAGFPVKNKDVVLSNSDQLSVYDETNYLVATGELLNKYYTDPSRDDVAIDFVGPSVDIGFRLATHSTSRKFVVSIGIPYILSMTSSDDPLVEDIKFRFDGTTPLKGVFGGLPYPIFWIDMGEAGTSSTLEDRLTHVVECESLHLRKYCAAFYSEQSAYTFRPFIHESGEHQLTSRPDWYDEQLKVLIKEFNKPSTKIEDGEDADAGETKSAGSIQGIIDSLVFVSSKIEATSPDRLPDKDNPYGEK